MGRRRRNACRMSTEITLARAAKAVEAGQLEGAEIGLAFTISIVDGGGHLVTAARMDGAALVSIEVSQAKARTSVLFAAPTANLAAAVQVDAPSLSTADFGWWHLNFRGWERTQDWMVSLFQQEQRFDGVFGFSQGAALTSLLVGMRGTDRLSFDFAMMVGGFRSDSPAHAH